MSDDESETDLMLLLLYHRYRKRRAERRFWVRDIYRERPEQGDFHQLIQRLRGSDEESHFNYFRMTRLQMDRLLHFVGPHLEPQQTNWRKDELGAAERLSLTVRFLATGDSYSSMGFAYRCSPATVCKVIKQTTKALWENLNPIYMPTPTTEMWQNNAKAFDERWNFPHCCGAIDGKHVVIKCPANSGSNFFNYKKKFSIVLMGVADAAYRFTTVDVGGYGKGSDGGTLSNTTFGESLERETVNFPAQAPLPGSSTPFPYVLVADEAFPLLINIQRPYPGTGLSKEKLIFNYRLKRARMVIENAFGIMCARWRIYHRVIEMTPETVDYVVLATCLLHNFLRNEGMSAGTSDKYCPPGYADTVGEDGEVLQNGKWRQEQPQVRQKKLRFGSNNYAKHVALLRTQLVSYFVSPAGAVPFQEKAIKKYLT